MTYFANTYTEYWRRIKSPWSRGPQSVIPFLEDFDELSETERQFLRPSALSETGGEHEGKEPRS